MQVTVKSLRKHRLQKGSEILDPKPLVVPVPIPSLAAQVDNLTRLGEARANAYWDDNEHWNDHEDGLDPEGLSPTELAAMKEDAEFEARHSKREKEPTKYAPKKAPSGAESVANEGGETPTPAEQNNTDNQKPPETKK
ncbi:hypothetical protein [Microviridae sp.]|nr:hypothetical protein [Microviridae sp.]